MQAGQPAELPAAQAPAPLGAAATPCPGLAEMLAGIAAGLDPQQGIVAEAGDADLSQLHSSGFEPRMQGASRARAMLPTTQWSKVEGTPGGYHRTASGDLQVPRQSPAAAAAARVHLAFDGSADPAAAARGEGRRHDAPSHRSLLEVLQYAGAVGSGPGLAPGHGARACADLEAARSDRWLNALWLEGKRMVDSRESRVAHGGAAAALSLAAVPGSAKPSAVHGRRAVGDAWLDVRGRAGAPDPGCEHGCEALREILAQIPAREGPGALEPRSRPRACAPMGSGGEGARALLQMLPCAGGDGASLDLIQAGPRARQGARSAGPLLGSGAEARAALRGEGLPQGLQNPTLVADLTIHPG
ncbi:hypothetical protein WJX81_005122 [Elliptochloris bilobata]|uniref:Uncharacterized protein n=1 Tax=Elliptochloris bilobata TaxID=381761 RepID=A0AAW1QLV0_9CHLO